MYFQMDYIRVQEARAEEIPDEFPPSQRAVRGWVSEPKWKRMWSEQSPLLEKGQLVRGKCRAQWFDEGTCNDMSMLVLGFEYEMLLA